MRAYLELCRVYLAPTAIADSFAGFALVDALLRPDTHPTVLFAIAGTSVLLYATGMVTNDIFDLDKDRAAAPARPLASGRVGLLPAAALAIALAAAGVGLAALSGAVIPAAGVLVLALAYNAGGKRLGLAGSLLMGGCRAGNLLIGATAAGGLATWTEWRVALAALLLGLFIALVTSVSLLEDRGPRKRPLLLLAGSVLALPAVLIGLNAPSVACWLASAALAFQLRAALVAALHPPTGVPPAAVFVRRALGAIPSADAAILLALARSPDDPRQLRVVIPVVFLYLLGVFAWWCKRRWLQSGGPET